MDMYAAKNNVDVVHKHYCSLTGKIGGHEHVITGVDSRSGRTKVDGWVPATRTVLEFHGDYYHGNPTKHAPEEWNHTTKCTFGALHEATVRRMQNLSELGYNVLYVWEGDFMQWKKKCGQFSLLPIKTFAK